MPQASEGFWPMNTPGMPESENPETSNVQSSASATQWSPTWCHTPGALTAEWGSFARSGWPVSVWDPATTNELDPTPSVPPTSVGTASSVRRAARTTSPLPSRASVSELSTVPGAVGAGRPAGGMMGVRWSAG